MKNVFKKTATMLLAMTMLIGTTACGEEPEPTPGPGPDGPPVEQGTTYALNVTSVSLEEGETKQLTVTATPEEEFEATYASSAEAVATVSESGLITAVSAGTATITVTIGEETLTCAVTVTAAPIEYSYALNVNTCSIEEEQTRQLTVMVDPDKEIEPEFVSSDDDIATVSESGLITGVSEGTATITVTVDGETLTCAVTVTPKPIQYSYALNKSTATIVLGETDTLTVTATPEKADIDVDYDSENEAIATVSSTGVVTAVGAGETRIVVVADGSEPMYCTVTVTADVAATVSAEDGAGKSVVLEDADDTLDTLYWEKYNGWGSPRALNTADIIDSNAANLPGGFGDYMVGFTWNYFGENSMQEADKHDGKHTENGVDGAEIVSTITVDENVKAIRVYTGAWNATNTTTLYWNDAVIAQAEPFTAGGASVAKVITFAVDVEKATTVKVVSKASAPTGGNVSIAATVVLGTAVTPETATTSVQVTKTEMTGIDNHSYNLTTVGTKDWYYLNFEDQGTDRKAQNGGNINVDKMEFFGNPGNEWDYKSLFTWTDGTTWATNGNDSDTSGRGTNNMKRADCYIDIPVAVSSEVNKVTIWVGGWQSTYHLAIVDSKGNLLYNEKVADKVDGSTFAYMVEAEITATENEEIRFVLYKQDGTNISVSAIAVS